MYEENFSDSSVAVEPKELKNNCKVIEIPQESNHLPEVNYLFRIENIVIDRPTEVRIPSCDDCKG